VEPEHLVGGDPFDQAVELNQRIAMLNQAVDQRIITQDEANTFSIVHEFFDTYTMEKSISGFATSGGRADALPQVLDALVSAGKISLRQSDTYKGYP
jgi:hypothetical protein